MTSGRVSVVVCVALTASLMGTQATGHAAQSASAVRVEQANGTPRYTNRLINEKSPYLQLHAHDPVDWFPWGPEAFEKARREGKPIFLSVGYSTCHWCHVMQAESFSDVGIAELMNRSFVSIKVDREERPDLDRVYQSYVISVLGVGGWPLSVFLTPELKPFVGDTYMEREDRNGRQGFRVLLQVLTTQWATNRDRLLALANDGTRSIEAQFGRRPAREILSAKVLDQAYAGIKGTYDAAEGGFRRAPKFARPVTLNFLLRDYARTGNKEALDMVLQTLRAMARGGIHDQLGGGFHRYAIDRAWRVPHFEKMLYDQAQIATAYTEAYQITKDAALAAVARDTLDYVLRDMRGPDGGFFSAEDADSVLQAGDPAAPRHAEGAFYVWTAEEIRAALGGEMADMFAFHHGAEALGNVPPQLDSQGDLAGKNILNVGHTVAETAAKFRKSQRDVGRLLAGARSTLLAARSARPRPSRDDKVLVAWNGLMVSALARAAQVFDDPRYLDAARASAGFIEARLYDRGTNLLTRRYRQGDAAIDGVLEDYAFLISGLLDLYEASFEVKWLSWAARLQEQQDRLFWDVEGGGYFSTRAEASNVLVRMKDDYDGDQPSANSVAAMNLLRLWQMADRQEWRDRADATFKALGTRLTEAGADVPQMAVAFAFALSKPRQIIIAGEPGASDTRAMLRLVHNRFMPNRILLLADGGPGQQQIAEWLPFFENITRRDGRATIYVCENYACRLPTSDLKVAARQLDGR